MGFELSEDGTGSRMTQQERCLWLIRELLKDMPQYRDTPVPALPERRWQLLRSLMNIRPPMPVTEAFCKQIGADAYTPDAASAADKAIEFCLAS